MIYLAPFIIIAFASIMFFYTRYKIPAIKSRDFGKVDFNWNKMNLISAIASFTIGTTAYYLSENIYVASSMTIVAFIAFFCSIVDLKMMLLPTEPIAMGIKLHLPFIILAAPSLDWLSLGGYFVMVIIFFVLWFMGKFGMGDLRLMMLFLVSMSWWFGIYNMWVAFVLAAVIALLSIPILNKHKKIVTKTKNQKTVYNTETNEYDIVDYRDLITDEKLDIITRREYRAIAGVKREDLLSEEQLNSLTRREYRKLSGTGKTGNHLPFGPPLLFAHLIMGFCLILTHNIVINIDFIWNFIG